MCNALLKHPPKTSATTFQPCMDITTQAPQSSRILTPGNIPYSVSIALIFNSSFLGSRGLLGAGDCPASNRSVMSFLEYSMCLTEEGEQVPVYLSYPTAVSFALTTIGLIFPGDLSSSRGLKDCPTSQRPLCHLAQQTVLCQQVLSKDWMNTFTSWKKGWAVGYGRWCQVRNRFLSWGQRFSASLWLHQSFPNLTMSTL